MRVCACARVRVYLFTLPPISSALFPDEDEDEDEDESALLPMSPALSTPAHVCIVRVLACTYIISGWVNMTFTCTRLSIVSKVGAAVCRLCEAASAAARGSHPF